MWKLTLLAAALAAPSEEALFGPAPAEEAPGFGPELPAAKPTKAPELSADPLAELLGEAPAPAPAPAPSALPAGGLALAGAAALMVGGLYLRRRLFESLKPGAPKPLRVIQRASVGGTSALLLVEVEDSSGATRRLLVGSGPGAPSLVADLSADPVGLIDLPEPTREPAPKAAAFTEALPLPPPTPRPARPATEEEELPPEHFQPRRVAPPARRVSDDELKRARSLVDDVLNKRVRPGDRPLRGVV